MKSVPLDIANKVQKMANDLTEFRQERVFSEEMDVLDKNRKFAVQFLHAVCLIEAAENVLKQLSIEAFELHERNNADKT